MTDAADGAPLIDRTALTEMYRAIGKPALVEVGLELSKSLRALVEELPELSAEEAAKRAHSLKGSTSYLGTQSLNEQAVAADAAAKQDRDPRPVLARLAALVEPSLAELARVISELPG